MKTGRQRKIMDIIEKQIISTQEELAEELQKAGFDVTQATVSRDIKELRLIKIPAGGNTYRYSIPKEQSFPQSEERLRRMFQDLVISMDYSENIVVLHTYPGNAHGIASLIDGSNWPEIIGSVAGDDTILLVVKGPGKINNQEAVAKLMDKLQSLME